MMENDKKTVRLLGAVFLIVFLASVISGTLLDSATGSGNISEKMISIAHNLTLMRISILVELVTSLGILALGSLLYIVFHEKYQVVSQIALGWWLAEGIILGISKIGAYALIPLSLDFVEAGAPEASFFQAIGDFFYNGFDRQGWALHMLFFCIGGILWYSLFYRSGVVPKFLAAWGVVSICLVTINVLISLFDRNAGRFMVMLLPYMVFEALIGPWLMIAGMKGEIKGSQAPVVASP